MTIATSVNSLQTDQVVWLLVVVGIITGLVSAIFISILFSWSMKVTLDNALKLFIFAIVTGTSVFTIGNTILNTSQSSFAAPASLIYDWKLETNTNLGNQIQFKTVAPARVYLEFHTQSGEVIPIFSGQSGNKATTHIFITKIPLTNGELYINVDGKRFNVTSKLP